MPTTTRPATSNDSVREGAVGVIGKRASVCSQMASRTPCVTSFCVRPRCCSRFADTQRHRHRQSFGVADNQFGDLPSGPEFHAWRRGDVGGMQEGRQHLAHGTRCRWVSHSNRFAPVGPLALQDPDNPSAVAGVRAYSVHPTVAAAATCSQISPGCSSCKSATHRCSNVLGPTDVANRRSTSARSRVQSRTARRGLSSKADRVGYGSSPNTGSG
jgi:hypothetical protein